MHILVVEDNAALAKGIAYALRDLGHAVDVLGDGAEADAFLRHCAADVVVLDITLPGMDGLAVLRAMRARGDRRPVLLLTARSEVRDRVAGLDAGADDYLAKPFAMEEFTARLRALDRRAGAAATPAGLAIGPLVFDPVSRDVTGPDGRLPLARRELAAFEALLRARGRTLSKGQMLDAIYGTGAEVDEAMVEVCISRLRKHLTPLGVRITARRGLGYLMEAAAE